MVTTRSLLLLAALGCGVPTSQYDAAVADQKKSTADLALAQKKIAELDAKVSELKGKQSRVYAAICDKYGATGGVTGPLGKVQLGADDAGGAKLDFENGIIAVHQVSPGKFVAYEVHGLIYKTYMMVTPAGSGPALLGLPVSDEEPWDTECPGGKRNRFERGSLVWCPGWDKADPRL